MNYSNLLIVCGLIALLAVIGRVQRSKQLAEEKEDILWCQAAIYGLSAARAELCDNFEHNIYLGYHCNELRKTYEEKYSKEAYQRIEAQHLFIFSSKSIEEQKSMAESVRKKLLSHGFTNFL